MKARAEKPPPNHQLFIKWGRLQIGAFGIPAVLTVLVALLAMGRFAGAW